MDLKTLKPLYDFLGVQPTESIRTGKEMDFISAAFPMIFEEHGAALIMRDGRVRQISDDFFAAMLGSLGQPDHRVVFHSGEQRFYQYHGEEGIYRPISEEHLHAQLSSICKAVTSPAEVPDQLRRDFIIRFGKTSQLASALTRAKALLDAPQFFGNPAPIVAVKNGILNLETHQLLAFSPDYGIRNKFSVEFLPDANCPRFLDEILRPIMRAEDIDLFQRWCGQLLSGKNHAQVLMCLIGPGGAGKGVITTIIESIYGETNISNLRPTHLDGRFETARYLGKTLLTGTDVRTDFLDVKSASVLKSLTGGDLLTPEIKGTHDEPRLRGIFNVLITANAMLRVKLDRDIEAWTRRLLIICVAKPAERSVNTSIADEILAAEGPGILNWMLEGLARHRDDRFLFKLTADQRALVEAALGASDGVRHFVDTYIEEDDESQVTLADASRAFERFCAKRNWPSPDRHEFSREFGEIVREQFGISQRHDLIGAGGKDARGWVGIRCTCERPGGGTLRVPAVSETPPDAGPPGQDS